MSLEGYRQQHIVNSGDHHTPILEDVFSNLINTYYISFSVFRSSLMTSTSTQYVYKLDMYRVPTMCVYTHSSMYTNSIWTVGLCFPVCIHTLLCVSTVCVYTRTQVCIQIRHGPWTRVSLFVSTHCSLYLTCVYTHTNVCIQTRY